MARVIQQSKPLYLQVVEHIKDRVAQGVYQKGDLLPSERELMEELHVGRVTVREGLRILGEEGVIRSVKGKGSFVQMSARQLQESGAPGDFRRRFMESTQLRLMLEPAVAREVALHHSPEELEDIRSHILDDSLPESFHRVIFRTTHNSLLIELFDRTTELETSPASSPTEPAQQEAFFAKFREQHKQIYDAILRQDGEAAYACMTRHMQYVQQVYEDYFRSFCS